MDQNKEKNEKAKRYHHLKIIFFFLDFIVVFTFLFLFVHFQGAHRFRDFVTGGTSTPWIQVLLYTSGLALFTYCLEIPIRLLGGYRLEKQYGLATLDLKAWWVREIKKGFLSLLFFLLIVETGYLLIWSLEGRWWLGLGAVWFVYSWLLAQVFPIWIVPLFYRYTPVRDEKLLGLLKSFASSQGRDIASVRVINLSKETKRANAAVLGIGKRKRIVFSDTLLKHFSYEEIKVIFAHELGHDKERHLYASLVFNALTIFGGIFIVQKILIQIFPAFQIERLTDLAALPLFLLLFSIFGFLLMPLQNGFSRILEKRADAFALKTTGLKDVFISAMKKLGEQNLADTQPNRWVEIFFHSHPSIARRIEFAKQF